MSRVVVVGGSSQGRQAIDVLECAAAHDVVGVIDRALRVGSSVLGRYPVVAPDAVDELGVGGFVVAIGDNTTRARVVADMRARCACLELVTAVHPAAVVARDATVGAGAIVMAGAVIGNGCVVGEGLLMGTNASLDHDCTVGEFASLAPGAITGGHVVIGDGSALLLGANVIHGRQIGAHTVVGAGAVVLRDVPDHVVAYGVPARVVRPRAADEPYLSSRS